MKRPVRFSNLVLVLAMASVTAGAGTAVAQAVDPDAVHRRALVLDGHVDVLLPTTAARYHAPSGGSRASLERLTAGGVDALVLSVAVGPGPRDAAGVRVARAEADEKLARIRAWVAQHPERLGVALSAEDVERLAAEGKVALLIGFQNARSIGEDLSQIDHFHRQGVRVFAFNHAGNNALSDSSRPGDDPADEHGGLSELGRRAVARLNDLGVLIDVSQLSDAALSQTLALTRAPVAATHSNVRGLVDNGRNLSDAELDAIRVNEGVVLATPFNAYVAVPGPETRRQVRDLRVRFGLSPEFASPQDGYGGLGDRQDAFLDEIARVVPRATVSQYVDHIDYIARRIGWRHVGVGTDFDHGAGVTGFDSEAEAPNVTRELLARGYSEEQVQAIWSGNFLRVLRAAQAAARP